ncbi:MAG: YqeG family HAD IIIA-type phosphatase [Staphylococcus equorum]|uniref:YqeG family HAD IIIA-type phosphatase n=1 Tax=Staphylococcus equorum TaxID=246432 RepID=A0AAW7AEI5_9STAP|nr:MULTISPECIES: YqeG family HAD IIIA-type phosphatase [Staphylococcus]EJX18974.1 VanW family protein [Staphylococcus sp. OJ82]MDK9844042.1 YqeG family HAD IIIA-type phosphatase [Staphylococcus equorum]MDK9864491.1 YqeG family HAD IIIA-type phosphatase [Staphylococcus equorum]
MKKILFPHAYLESVFDIDFEKVYNLGYEALIFDIDSTLVPHGNDSTDEIDELFKFIHSLGLKTILLSNNSEERIESFNTNIKTSFIPLANKPHKSNYLKAIKMLGVEKSKVLFIGDQIFTDILGANLCGIKNVLVKFLVHEGEIKIGKKRKVENIILKIFTLNQSYTKSQFKIER